MLRLDKVVTYYGPMMALKGIDLEVRNGEIVCLLGGNASGKSTTMKTILGLVRPHSGTVTFDGDTPERARHGQDREPRHLAWCPRRAASSAA